MDEEKERGTKRLKIHSQKKCVWYFYREKWVQSHCFPVLNCGVNLKPNIFSDTNKPSFNKL